MHYGWISTNVLDMWSAPRFESERVSQLLFGAPVKVSSQRAGFCQVQQPDGYRGWVDSRFVAPAKRSYFERRGGNRRYAVRLRRARLCSERGRVCPPPHEIYYGTRLAGGLLRGGFVRFLLPNGDAVYVKPAALRPISAIKSEGLTGSAVMREAARFLGVPYLWGGVTVTGFDCSGFVRAVFGSFGVELPRDTKDQIQAGRKVPRHGIKTGDLLFFDRHVGIARGRDQLIHASRDGGGVRVESLRPGRKDYREDLDRDFREARRILPCTSTASK